MGGSPLIVFGVFSGSLCLELISNNLKTLVMIKDQCNNCKKYNTSSCNKNIVFDYTTCDDYVKKLDLSKPKDNIAQPPLPPIQSVPHPSNEAISNKNESQEFSFSSFFSFSGRIRRTRYWLTNFFVGLMFLPGNLSGDEMSDGVAIFTLIIFIPAIWISLANSVKRFHDLGKSGWYTCLTFIPLLNIVFGIYAAFFKGEESDNEYGPNPY